MFRPITDHRQVSY